MTLDALDFPRILEMTSKVRIDCRPSMDVHVSMTFKHGTENIL